MITGLKTAAIVLRSLRKILVVAPGIALVLAGCAEQVGNGQTVSIPFVSISCSTNNCRFVGTAKAYIVYTTSSCANSQFGETIAGSTTLSCNSLGCTGTVTAFTGTSGASAYTIKEGFYSVCAILDFNSNYLGSAVSGDATGGLANTNITSGTTTQAITSFADVF